jgi:phage-related protein
MVDVLRPLPLQFWLSPMGQEPVREWLASLAPEDKKVIGRDIAKVQYRWPLGLPLCRPLGNGLWEVRSSLPSKREARVIFGFQASGLIALHAFIKKSQTTAEFDLALARKRWKDMA